MDNNTNYEKYIDERFSRLFAEIKASNDIQDFRLNEMKVILAEVLLEAKKTNSRVNKLESTQENCSIKDVKKNVEKNNETINEIKYVKKYLKPIITGLVASIFLGILSILKTFGFI